MFPVLQWIGAVTYKVIVWCSKFLSSYLVNWFPGSLDCGYCILVIQFGFMGLIFRSLKNMTYIGDAYSRYFISFLWYFSLCGQVNLVNFRFMYYEVEFLYYRLLIEVIWLTDYLVIQIDGY